jgi:cyclopropane fatty-acyl-phospholipid synthase-like methyltransferase
MADDSHNKEAPTTFRYRVTAGADARAARRQFAPAAERNAEPIIAVLKQHLPERGRALEVASGTGQHAVAFARAFLDIDWVPSDPDPKALDSIAGWIEEAGLANLALPLRLDVSAPDWHEQPEHPPYDAILAINMVHIAPWEATEGLMRGAAALLAQGGILYLYGAYKRDGEHTAPSNVEFDRWLRAQNPEWGVRDLCDVERVAAGHGLELVEVVPMPANNLSVIFRKS